MQVRKNKKNAFFALSASILLLALLFNTGSVSAAMSSASYTIEWDTISSGGSDDSSSASYQLRDTIGNTAIGSSTSASYALRAGYRQGVQDQVLTYSLLPQVAATTTTANSYAGTAIEVGATGAFTVGDYIVLIQDEGAAQVSAIGQLVSKDADTLTVDSLTDSGTAPVIDGTNDAVYLLDGTSVSLGEITTTEVSTGVIGWNITADSPNGYTIQLQEDENLTSGANDIDDVVGGSVDIGNEEYGAISSDGSLATSTFDTEDTAITGSFQAIGTRNDTSYDSRDFLTLKAAASVTTASGAYSHVLTFVVTGNY